MNKLKWLRSEATAIFKEVKEVFKYLDDQARRKAELYDKRKNKSQK